MKVLEKALNERKLSVKHLKLHGPLCSKNIHNQRWTKLDDKSESVVFSGYRTTRSYKLYNLITLKVIEM